MLAQCRFPRIARLLAAGLVLCAAIPDGAGAAASKKSAPAKACANDRDMAALNARVVQTELMVAALSCQEAPRYNQFTTSYREVLVDRAGDLKAFFQRTMGSKGVTRMDSLVTQLANDASKQSQMRADTYCQFAGDMFEHLLQNPPQNFNAFTANQEWVTARHGFSACKK
ncbi:MAG: hypothetical protein U1E42_13040 [Rhodospirillales bacterium]